MWCKIADALNPPRPGSRGPTGDPAPPQVGGAPGTAPGNKSSAGLARYTCCRHPQCLKSAALAAALRREASRLGLVLQLAPAYTLCRGACADGPYLGLPERELFYAGVTPAEAPSLLEETSLRGGLVFGRLLVDPLVVFDSRVIYRRHQSMLVAMEDGYCTLGLAAYLFDFNAAESCGKCYPCRLGVHLIHRLLHGLMAGKGDAQNLERLRQAANALASAGYCEFGERVSEPLRLALEMAWPEFERHASQGGCAKGELFLGSGPAAPASAGEVRP